jgi:uncharacterized protein (DUF433 family)
MDDIFVAPRYTLAETARLVRMHPARVSRWLNGYSYRWPPGTEEITRQSPVIVRDQEGTFASFGDLVELWFIKQLVSKKTSLSKARAAAQEAAEMYGPYPFARRKVYLLGNAIILEAEEAGMMTLVELLKGGQRVFPAAVEACADEIVFDDLADFASRIYPMGRSTSVVIDPAMAFGSPTVKDRGVQTANVYDLYEAEERQLDRVCQWFHLTEDEVLAAIAFEERKALGWRAA